MKLKKHFLAVALAACSVPVWGQESSEPKVEFKPHAYLQLQGGAGYTLGEAKFKDLISPAAALSFGYQFTPVFGARVGVSGWESRGGWVNPATSYSYNYVAGNLDAMFNLSNLFCGFNPKRVFNLSAFVGGAVNYAFNNDDATALATNLLQTTTYQLEYLWNESKVLVAGRAGLHADFRLSDRFSLNLEANANVLSDHYNSKKAGNADWYFNALAGVTLRLGKSYRVVEPVLPVPVTEPVKKEEPVQKPVVKEEVKKPVVKPVAEEYRCDVFFEINSSVISAEEETKIAALAEYMKQHPEVKVDITGYADVKTGNAKINERLSKVRSEEVRRMLISKFGIDASRISIAYKGDTEQPFSENVKNRVCICLAK